MRLDLVTFSIVFIIIAVSLIVTIASQVIIDEQLRPRSAFTAMVAGVIISGGFSLLLNIDLPE
jgi:hypothetical protein